MHSLKMNSWICFLLVMFWSLPLYAQEGPDCQDKVVKAFHRAERLDKAGQCVAEEPLPITHKVMIARMGDSLCGF